MAQWLGHWISSLTDPVRFPRQAGKIFQLCFIPLLQLSCRKMGARPGLDFFSPRNDYFAKKWIHLIIYDDFLEKGECYDLALLPSIICLGRLHIACRYIFNQTTASGS